MQSISGYFYPTGATAVTGAMTAATPNATATLTAVNNIMTALVGGPASTQEAAAPQLATTMSGALGNSIGSLLKTADNKLDMSNEDWAQEVLQHQDSCDQINQNFAGRLTSKEKRLGQSGFQIPGFDSQEFQDLIREE